MLRRLSVALLALLAVGACNRPSRQPENTSNSRPSNVSSSEGSKMHIRISSTVFQDNGLIPAKYTCDGANVSPPLDWSGVPANAKSIALIVDDPDAPAKTWVHWVAYDLAPTISQLSEDIKPVEIITGSGKNGRNDFNKLGYGGPCPPSGTHRYFFKIYALDIETGLKPGATKDELLRSMEGHIVSQGELMGKYKRAN